MEDSHYRDLLLELECPICTNYMSPPIRQCSTGHSICEDCMRKLSKCALCQGAFTNCRNISLEGLAIKMRYPCINRNAGCSLKLTYNERAIHESRCLFRTYKCAMEKCSWVGRLDEISQHWASKQRSSKPYCENNVCHIKIKPESYYINLVEAFNQLFWFKCKCNNSKLCWALQYIGNSKEAENYCYEIEILKAGRVKQKILLGDYCQPVDVDNSLLFSSGCVCISSNVIKPFLNNDQTFTYNLRVCIATENKSHEREFSGPSAPERRRDGSKEPQNRGKYWKESYGKKPKNKSNGFAVM